MMTNPLRALCHERSSAFRWLLAAAWLGSFGIEAVAQPVKCHLEYAGVKRSITVMPTACPAQVLPQVEGTSVVLKVVNAASPAQERGVTIQTQARQNDALQTVHEAHYLAWEASTTPGNMPYGFTGLQTVSPTAQSYSLRYWCEKLPPAPALNEEDCSAALR